MSEYITSWVFSSETISLWVLIFLTLWPWPWSLTYFLKIFTSLYHFNRDTQHQRVYHKWEIINTKYSQVDVFRSAMNKSLLREFSTIWGALAWTKRLRILWSTENGTSSEGSLTCHTYCDTGLPFIMVISEDPWHSHLMPSVWQWSCYYLFLRLRSVATGYRTLISRMRGERSTPTPPRRLYNM